MKIQTKITAASIALVTATVAIICVVALIQTDAMRAAVERETDKLTQDQLASVAQDVYRMCLVEQQTMERSLRHNLITADRVLRDEGSVDFDVKARLVDWTASNQFTNATTSVALARMTVGGTWLGQNTDAAVTTPVVDPIQSLTGAACTVFQRMNTEGDMLRVATNVKNKDGRRAIGTYIPHRMADGSENAVVASVLAGQNYVGRAFVVDSWYLAAYQPLRNAAGEISGMLFVGVPDDPAGVRRQSILDIKLGSTGYVYVITGTGAQRGVYVVSQGGKRDGENIWEAKDSAGGLFIQSIVKKGLATKNGTVDFERYPWKNDGDVTARYKVAAVTYFAPWDWVIGAGAYEDEFRAASARVGESIQRIVLWIVGVSLVLLVAAALSGFLVARNIAQPVARATEAAGRMALGDFTLDLQHSGKDEVGEMVKAFGAMAEAQTRKAELAKQIAEGDLRSDIAVASERDVLGQALKEMTRNLNEVLGEVQGSVSQVSTGSDQVAQSSQALSQGATEQASSLEEISSSLTQINGQAKQNAANATEANALAKTAVEDAEKGNERMQALAAAMARIGTATQEITKVVKLIDDIAFQINLLALNANVEAARAGKYGKGFAVVAEEVRNLAVRSAGAVKDTTRMVEEATKSIGEGSQTAEGTAKQLGSIVQSVAKVAGLLEEIAVASKEQAQGVDQITSGLDQMDQVTQSNTASAEESAAAAEELSSQGQHLKTLIARFMLKADASAAHAAPSSGAGAVVAAVAAARSGRAAPHVPRSLPAARPAGGGNGGNGGNGGTVAIGAAKASVTTKTLRDPKAVIRLDDDDFGKF
jgi:methyl-accepting chemotaxis protein